MNLQIFGRKKGFDSKKAERFFKERNIKFQWVDLEEKGISPRELQSLLDALGMEKLVDRSSKDKAGLARFEMASKDAKFELLLEFTDLLKKPIVRNGKKATVGVEETIWKQWIDEERKKDE